MITINETSGGICKQHQIKKIEDNQSLAVINFQAKQTNNKKEIFGERFSESHHYTHNNLQCFKKNR